MLKGFDVSQPDESKRNERGKMCDFSKQRKTKVLDLQQYTVKMDLSSRQSMAKQIEMLNLTKKDLQYLKAFQPIVMDNVDHIVNRFTT